MAITKSSRRQQPAARGSTSEARYARSRKWARQVPEDAPSTTDLSEGADEHERQMYAEIAAGVFRPKPAANARTETPPSLGRLDALDLARGFAVCLMILSHGVKGLMTFEQMPAWGLVPIHLVTKFSSSLFLLVFGMSLAITFMPHVGTPSWPKKRKKLLIRGLVVLFWYKALTILEMSHLYGRDEIFAALTYQAFPVYVEILGYYAIALLWIPWVLPFWKRSSAAVRLSIPVVMFAASTLLSTHFDFFGNDVFKALVVEHNDHYAWGQLARAPLVFAGLLIGWMVQLAAPTRWPRLLPAGILLGGSLTFFALFHSRSKDALYDSLVRIAMNAGKHPPEATFMLFSLGGALLLLGLSVAGGRTAARLLPPVTTIGKNSLQAFVFHIVVIFVFYRFLFDYFHKVEYGFALSLALLTIAMTYVWLKLTKWVKDHA